jgi:hypothetical protein
MSVRVRARCVPPDRQNESTARAESRRAISKRRTELEDEIGDWVDTEQPGASPLDYPRRSRDKSSPRRYLIQKVIDMIESDAAANRVWALANKIGQDLNGHERDALPALVKAALKKQADSR